MTEQETTIPKPSSEDMIDEAKEHARAARAEMRRSIEALMPKGFVEHRRAARKEMLLAMRSLIDAAVARIDERAQK